MASGTVEDKRKHPRKGKTFLVKFRVAKGPSGQEVGERLGWVSNFSSGGVCLVSKRSLPKGTFLDLTVPKGVFSGGERKLQGMVRWSEEQGPGADCPMGLRFMKMTGAEEKPSSGVRSAATASEKRRHARRSENVVVKIRCISEGFFKENDPRGARLLNLSRGGMELTCKREYTAGCVLEVRFPEDVDLPKALARVEWTREASRKDWFHLGLSFFQGS